MMSTTITVRDLNPRDKAWLQREAKRVGLSMEALVRRIIEERRMKSERREKPSEIALRLFGPEHGVELRARSMVDYRALDFEDFE